MIETQLQIARGKAPRTVAVRIEDDALRCATVTESVTGTAYVIVRGPAAS